MNHCAGDNATALKELKSASTLKYHDANTGDERPKNYDEYLSAPIKEFIPAIEQDKVPDGLEK